MAMTDVHAIVLQALPAALIALGEDKAAALRARVDDIARALATYPADADAYVVWLEGQDATVGITPDDCYVICDVMHTTYFMREQDAREQAQCAHDSFLAHIAAMPQQERAAAIMPRARPIRFRECLEHIRDLNYKQLRDLNLQLDLARTRLETRLNDAPKNPKADQDK
jgi:hypothetical protein